MKIIKFEANNLFSLGEISLDLNNRGLILVTGYSEDEGSSNGSGKSSLANKGLLWTLYGATANGIRADNVTNLHTFGQTIGRITFVGEDEKLYTIERTRNPSSLTLLSEDADLTNRHEKETQKLIDHLLGKTLQTFLFTDFFGQGVQTNFLALTSKAQLELLESILPMEDLTNRALAAKLKVKESNINTLTLTEDFQKTSGRQTQLKAQKVDLQQSSILWQNKKDQELQRLEGLRAETPYKEKIQELINSSKEIKDTLDKTKNLKDQMKENILQLQELNKAKTKLDLDVANLRSQVREIKDEQCPICDQKININLTKTLRDQQQLIQLKKAISSSTSSNLIPQIEELDNKGVQISKEINERNKGEILFNAQSQELQQLRLQQQFKEEKLEQEITRLQGSENPYTALILTNDQGLQEATDRLVQLNVGLQEAKDSEGRYAFWANAFGKDLKNYVIAKSLSFLQRSCAQYLNDLNNSQIHIEFLPIKQLKNKEAREGFTVSVSSETGGSNFASLSGGEQQISNFAVGLAMSDLAEARSSSLSNLLILDEPFIFLSPRNCENVVQFLAERMTKRRSTILLISNEDEVTKLVPERVHIIKKAGISHIQED